MEKLNANEIKIGILSYIRKKIINSGNSGIWTIKVGWDLRGILFTEEEKNISSDILYPTNKYPMLGQEEILTPTIGITKNENLGPLLKYYNLDEFSYQDLQKFTEEVLLNKKWLEESGSLFGFTRKKYGPLTLTYTYYGQTGVLPESLGHMIHDVHNKNGLSLSKKEQKQYRPR